MSGSPFHFETPLWLWGIGLIPFVWIMYKLTFRERKMGKTFLDAFIDKALLPHLLLKGGKSYSFLGSFMTWAILWSLLMGALANPRWDYKEVKVFSPDQNICILLDISQSMEVRDIKPSRLIRARQKIQDILKQSEGMKVGLIAYAAHPHMVSPLTEDKETLLHFLPSLDTDLPYVQGSRLFPALVMASRLLKAAKGHNKSILILTDGGFEDEDAFRMAEDIAGEGTRLYILGVGTSSGAPIPKGKGGFIRTKSGKILISKLEKNRLGKLATRGKGRLVFVHPLDQDVNQVMKEIKNTLRPRRKPNRKHIDGMIDFIFLFFLCSFSYYFGSGEDLSFLFFF